jgi:PIN domain nuclease of toxin-antitoxin system
LGSNEVKLLLDTHIWIWGLQDPSKLRPKIAVALTDAKSELWLSPISIWEVVLLVEHGRLKLRGIDTPRKWVDAALAKVPVHEAMLTSEVALQSRTVRMGHEDPADRFLAATANVYDLTLVTADERLLAGKGYRTLANRRAR